MRPWRLAALFAALLFALAAAGAHAEEAGRELAVMAWSGAAAGSAAADAADAAQRGCGSIVGCINEVQRRIAEMGGAGGGGDGQASTTASAIYVIEVMPERTVNADGTMAVKAKVTDYRLDITPNTPAATKRQIDAEVRDVRRKLAAWTRTLTLDEVAALLKNRRMSVPVPEPFAALKVLSKPTLVLTLLAPDEGTRDICSLLDGQRAALQRRLDELKAQRLPDERLDELLSYLATIRSLAADTSEGADKQAEKIGKVSERIKDIFPRISAALDRVVKGVGNVTGKLKAIVELVDKVTPPLEEAARMFREIDSGSAGDQIRNLKKVFDAIRKTLPVDEVPGLGALFDAYSDAMDGIATSADSWEGAMKRFAAAAKDADELHRDFVIRARGPREQRADAINRATADLEALDRRLTENDCHPAKRAEGLCDRVRAHVDRVYVKALAATQPLRDKIGQLTAAKDAAKQRTVDVFKQRMDKVDTLERLRTQKAKLRKTDADYAGLEAQEKALLAEIGVLFEQEKAAQQEWFDKGDAEKQAIADWQNAVRAELNKTVGWTDSDLTYLRFCLPGGFVLGER